MAAVDEHLSRRGDGLVLLFTPPTVTITEDSRAIGMWVALGVASAFVVYFLRRINFALASRDRFFLLVESRDDNFDRTQTAEFLRTLGPREVTDVEY